LNTTKDDPKNNRYRFYSDNTAVITNKLQDKFTRNALDDQDRFSSRMSDGSKIVI